MSMLLLIRSADGIRSAVEAASELLLYRRRAFAEPREADEVLGIWLRPQLDADLPTWFRDGGELGAGARIGVQRPTEATVGVRESFSLSGLWSLCWIDGTVLREAKSANERRNRIVGALVSAAERQPGAFLPVFHETESTQTIGAMLQDLRVRHPDLIPENWFLDHRERGLVAWGDGR